MPTRQRNCEHLRQCTAGSNQFQGMIQCLECGKLMGQLYHRVDMEVAQHCPPFNTLIGQVAQPLRQKVRLLEEENEDLNNVIANLSHELRSQKGKMQKVDQEWQQKVNAERRKAKKVIATCLGKLDNLTERAD